MSSETLDSIERAARTAKSDWKSVASLLLALLIAVGGLAWMVAGQAVRAASSKIEQNTQSIIRIESDQVLIEAQVRTTDRRMDEFLMEIKAMNVKLNQVSESQARMEGVLIGRATPK